MYKKNKIYQEINKRLSDSTVIEEKYIWMLSYVIVVEADNLDFLFKEELLPNYLTQKYTMIDSETQSKLIESLLMMSHSLQAGEDKARIRKNKRIKNINYKPGKVSIDVTDILKELDYALKILSKK